MRGHRDAREAPPRKDVCPPFGRRAGPAETGAVESRAPVEEHVWGAVDAEVLWTSTHLAHDPRSPSSPGGMATGNRAAVEVLRPSGMSHALSEVGDDASSERVAANAGQVLTE